MKFIIKVLLFIGISNFTFGQITITDPDNDQSNPISCASYTDGATINFFDDGGSGGNYSSNVNETITICPDLPNGPKITAAFATNAGFSWDVDGSDTLYVFDGPTTSAPLLGAYNSATDPNGFNHTASFANNPSGCLTFLFVSNGTTEGTGWGANITCSSPAQPIGPSIEAFINGGPTDDLNPADTGYVDVCFGDSILLVATPDLLYSLENNGFGYSQNVDDLTFEWEFSDGTIGANNDSIWFTPPTRNGYFVNLFITDDFPQTVQTFCKIRVSQLPSFEGTGPLDDTVCFNQETVLLGGASPTDTVGVEFPPGSFEVGGSFAGLLPLPDGSGINYSTDIEMTSFPPGATFSAPSDLQEICFTIEHSYLGDLEVWLECPNGSTVSLINSYSPGQLPGGFNGGGTYLGEPIDNNTGNPGNGYEYCFSATNNTWGDFATEFANGNTIAITAPPAPSTGNTMNPNGVYEPEDPFTNLNGCPLNGDWTLNIRDNIGIDDGFIFEWGLFFDAQLFPNNESYQNTIVDSYWSPEPSIISGLNGDTSITVNPNTPGDFFYTFNVEDDFGCLYDTTVTLHVLDTIATVTSLDTTVFCATDSIPLWVTATGLEPFNYTWSNGDSGDTSVVSALENGTTEYYITITDACGVETIDTSFVTLNQTLAIDTMLQFPSECGAETGAVSGQGSGFTGTPDYQWSGPGAGNPNNIDATVWQDLPSGWYYFTIEDNVCFVEDSIFLEQEPPPTADFDANPTSGFAPLDVTFVNNSDPADSYEWDFGNGEGVVVNNLDNQNTTYTEEGLFTVTLTVTEGSCVDEATETIDVTLFLPLSYDMPNVFTPNSDNSNDLFTLNTVNATDLELIIFNRWGNVVFESTEDVNAAWNGRVDNNGAECNDGTYFYKFIIFGAQGEEIEEHGFVQLVRD